MMRSFLRLKKQYPDNPRSTSPRQIYNFLHQIKPGDKIVVNKGKKIILAYGLVESEPIFESTNVSKIIRKVTWEKIDQELPVPDSLKGKFLCQLLLN